MFFFIITTINCIIESVFISKKSKNSCEGGDSMNNQVLHIGICDDEPIIMNVVKEKCESIMESTGFPYDISCFTDGVLLLEHDENFDFVILDIEMPNINGLEVAKRLKKKDEHCTIVILTSYNEFMQQGYVAKAFRYLTKPIDDIELKEAIMGFIEEKINNKSITINSDGKIHLIHERDIFYVESLGEGSAVITPNDPLICNYTMKDWLRMLNKDAFILSHRTYIVHLKYVKNITRTHVVLVNNKEVQLARRKYKEVKNKFLQYVSNYAHHRGG